MTAKTRAAEKPAPETGFAALSAAEAESEPGARISPVASPPAPAKKPYLDARGRFVDLTDDEAAEARKGGVKLVKPTADQLALRV